MVGVAVAAVGLAWGFAAVGRLRRSMERPADGDLWTIARRAAQALLLRRPPRLLLSRLIRTPVSIGLLRPVIVLPVGILEEMDREQVEAVLLHEMGHIARCDRWVGLVQRFSTALFWWNPLVRRAAACLSDLREDICDNYVLRVQGNGERLARALVDIAAQTAQGPLSPSTLGVLRPGLAHLSARIKRLLNEDRRREISMNLTAKLLVWAGGVAALAAMGLAGSLVIVQASETAAAEAAGEPKSEGSTPAAPKPAIKASPEGASGEVSSDPPRTGANAILEGDGAIDLTYVPGAADAFVAIRPADIVKRPEYRGLTRLIEEHMGPGLGSLRLPVAKIAQITLVPRGRLGHPSLGDAIIYQMTEPYDFKTLLDAAMPGRERREYQSAVGRVPPLGPVSQRVVDGQTLWLDPYAGSMTPSDLKRIVREYRQSALKSGQPAAEPPKPAAHVYYADPAGRKGYALLPDDRTLVFAGHESLLGEIFGPDQPVYRVYTPPEASAAVLVVWSPMRGKPRLRTGQVWPLVRGDHVMVWALQTMPEAIETWPGVPSIIEEGLKPFAQVWSSAPTFLSARLDAQVRIHCAINVGASGAPEMAKAVQWAVQRAANLGQIYRHQVRTRPGGATSPLASALDDSLGLLEGTRITHVQGVVWAESVTNAKAVQNLIDMIGGPIASGAGGQTKPAPVGQPNRDTVPPTEVVAKEKAAATPFQDEPAAHALYNQMIVAMQKAKSLSYVSHYEMEGKGFKQGCTYRAWLKKPNYFRVEAEASLDVVQSLLKAFLKDTGGGKGVLIGDGNTLWIYWPNGRFMYGPEDQAAYEKTRLTSYMKKPAPPGRHSIGHETGFLGAGMGMPIMDPSTFHGYTDSLQPYVDGVKSLGAEKIGEEECDQIEVSIMKHQRSWYLWLSKRDHLPRKLKQVVRVSYDIVMTEEWSSVTLDADIPSTMFVWKPPDGWTEWKLPPIEAGLLKPGSKAPDFDLASADGKRIKLSDYRGRVVWFYVWRAG
jgi:outer membrane lipoprotein-sorting protein